MVVEMELRTEANRAFKRVRIDSQPRLDALMACKIGPDFAVLDYFTAAEREGYLLASREKMHQCDPRGSPARQYRTLRCVGCTSLDRAENSRRTARGINRPDGKLERGREGELHFF